MYHWKELTELAKRTGMPLSKDNGQIRYGPPLNPDIPSPPRGSEVFVGKLSRHFCASGLVEVFGRVGRLYQFRLPMNNDGSNRRYCFIQYFSPLEANRAIQELNGFEIHPGRRIGVVKSFDNNRLFVRGIPRDKTAEEISAEMERLTARVVQIHGVPYVPGFGRDRNRGFAIVEYETHRSAAVARHTLINGPSKPWGDAQIAVYWAEPEVENLVLLVSGFPPHVTNSALEDIFNVISGNGFNRMTRKGGIAYVHFHTHAHAVKAKTAIQRFKIDGVALLEVHWGRDMIVAPLPLPYQRVEAYKIRIDFNLPGAAGPCVMRHPKQDHFLANHWNLRMGQVGPAFPSRSAEPLETGYVDRNTFLFGPPKN